MAQAKANSLINESQDLHSGTARISKANVACEDLAPHPL